MNDEEAEEQREDQPAHHQGEHHAHGRGEEAHAEDEIDDERWAVGRGEEMSAGQRGLLPFSTGVGLLLPPPPMRPIEVETHRIATIYRSSRL